MMVNDGLMMVNMDETVFHNVIFTTQGKPGNGNHTVPIKNGD